MSTCKDKTKKGKCTGSYDKVSMNGTGKKSNGPKRNSGTSRNVGIKELPAIRVQPVILNNKGD